jgi:hypothetical protein
MQHRLTSPAATSAHAAGLGEPRNGSTPGRLRSDQAEVPDASNARTTSTASAERPRLQHASWARVFAGGTVVGRAGSSGAASANPRTVHLTCALCGTPVTVHLDLMPARTLCEPCQDECASLDVVLGAAVALRGDATRHPCSA